MLETSVLVGDPRILENELQSRLMEGCAAIARWSVLVRGWCITALNGWVFNQAVHVACYAESRQGGVGGVGLLSGATTL